MTGKSLVINIDPTLSPVCIREVLEGMDQGDLVENALDAICRAHELQALFESTQVEQERSATYTDASDRHIVDLTDQIKARDLEIDGLRKEKEKNVAALDDVRKACDVLRLELTAKEVELKKNGDVVAFHMEEIARLSRIAAEQEEALRSFEIAMQEDSTKSEQHHAKFLDLQRALEKTQGERDLLVADLQSKNEVLESLTLEKTRLTEELKIQQRLVEEKDVRIERLTEQIHLVSVEAERKGAEQIDRIAAQVAAMAVKDGEIAALRAAVAEKDRKIVRLKTKVHSLREAANLKS